MRVVDFFATHGSAPRSFYWIRGRAGERGADDSCPNSTAPRYPARRWGDDLTSHIAAIHAELKAGGFGCGAISVLGHMARVEGLDEVPSEWTNHLRLSM